jgi:PTS system cellobiose-specific IIC component
MPLTIVGSIFLLLVNFPWQPVVNVLAAWHLVEPFNQIVGATFGIIALVAVVGIAYEYAKAEKLNGLTCGIIALVAFLTIQESFIVTADGIAVGNIINKGWTGGSGMIAAIIIGIVTGYVYCWFLKRNIRIKLPESVPEGVSNSFNGLIPGFVIFLASAIIYAVFKYAWDITLMEAIYKVIQLPLQGMTDSLPAVIIMGMGIPFLWFFGIHGATVISGVMTGILQANMMANQAILDSGLALTIANGGHIVTQQFLDQFMTVTGSGMTIGIVIYMIFFAKSKQNKELGKLGGVPGLFNINEPILFGTPIVLNPFLAAPFILMPAISGCILYFCQYFGIVPLFSGVMVPWTTPPIISGFIIGGWKVALLQAFVLSLSFFVYLPFIRKVDKDNLAAELAAK